LTVSDSVLVVTGDGFERRAGLTDIEIGERFGPAPLLVRFADGAFCEVHDERALRELIGGRPGNSAVQRWEQSWRWVAVSAIVFLCLVIVTYRYGLPAAAAAVAQRLPVSALDTLSDQTLAALDGRVLQPTALEPHRQRQVAKRFERLRLPGADEQVRFKVLFRKSNLLGANALALPSGTIVVTDELVALAKDDDEIAAVLAHEAGHVVRRHGLRQLLQDSVVALCVTWYIGDISSLVAVAQPHCCKPTTHASSSARPTGSQPTRCASTTCRWRCWPGCSFAWTNRATRPKERHRRKGCSTTCRATRLRASGSKSCGADLPAAVTWRDQASAVYLGA
jgi:hypothetical protein